MADLVSGKTWSSGEEVTAALLNQMFSSGTISTAFLTGKSSITAPVGTDKAMVLDVSASAFKQVTLDNLIYKAGELINGQSNVSADELDLLLLRDVSGAVNGKATIKAAIFENVQLYTGRGALTTPDATGIDVFLVHDINAGVNKVINRQDLLDNFIDLYDFSEKATFAGSLASDDLILFRDISGTPAQHPLKIGDIVTRQGVTMSAGEPADADELLIYDADGANSEKVTLTNLKPYFQTGCIMQVQQTVATDARSNSGTGAWESIGAGLSVAITPRDANSKVMVRVVLQVASSQNIHFRLTRGGSPIAGALGDAASSRIQATASGGDDVGQTADIPTVAFSFLDSPASASPQTYEVEWYPLAASKFNNSRADTDNTSHARVISTITAEEVAA